MKRFFPFLILLLAAVSCTSEQKRVFNIADLGAVDGQVCTRAIQQAMDQCSEAGGYWDNMLLGVSLEPGKDKRVGRSAAALLCRFC